MIKTFICHNSSDHACVDWLKTKLERENLGLDIFVDDGSIFCGDDPQKMIDEVQRSIIFFPVLSNESVKKEFVQNEIKTAIANEATHIFPVKLNCDEENIPEIIKTHFLTFEDKEEESLSKEDKQILSSASKMAVFLPQIDTESIEWLILSARYVYEDFNASFFIEYLDDLKEKGDLKETAKYIGNIYLKMLEKITPDYNKKHIRSIIEFLYNNEAQDNANHICNIYGSRGYELLRDIYEKYNAAKEK